MLLLRALFVSVCLIITASSLAQEVVPVGEGSYASYPPAHEGADPAGMQQREIYVVDSNGLPVPTNDWWTNLLVTRYAGAMWAYPLTVSADDRGVRVTFPQDFNADGSHMMLGDALRVEGNVTATVPANADVLADFEGEMYPPGWTTTGTAFGSGPAAGALTGQSVVTGFLGERLVNSFYGGDGPTGTLVSPTFVIARDYLHFLIAGGDHPDETEVRLIVDSAIVRTATGDNSESLDWHTWDVQALAGMSAHLEIVDLSSGGWGHICADQFVLSDDAENPADAFSTDFTPADTRAAAWSDWLVRFRSADSLGRTMDVTMGHGLPFVWVEFEDVAPRLVTPQPVRYFDQNGTVSTFPITTDHLGIELDDRFFGVYLPSGTQIDLVGGDLTFEFAGAGNYLVVGALPAEGDLAVLYSYAYALPRVTQFNWTFDRSGGTVTTNWTVAADSLKSGATTVLQGWLPHHYRTTTHDLSFNGLEYSTPRGKLRMAAGNAFSIQRPFHGILPNLPAPIATGAGDHDFDPERLRLYLAMYAGVTSYGSDTYWGGKDLVRLARYMAFADETGEPNARDAMMTTLRSALSDWLTYAPTETERYFAAYPAWGALVGFNESYYSFEFTDHHFHYGYFTMASALLGMYDESYLADYGPMITLVAKEYANWDRTDTRFPYLRTFDPWRGHSYAGGLSSPGGNNQESSSEAIQSWAGLFLLGTMLGDEDMTAAGAMGYAVETEAVAEYWQNRYGAQGGEGTFSPLYERDITGILFDDGQAYATYFSGDPAWVFGIQWLPISPALNYLVRDPAFAEAQYNAMMVDRDVWLAEEEGGENTFSPMGTSLGNVVLGYLQLFDSARAAAELDTLWDAADPVARDNYTGGITYYFAHANRMLGEILWDWRIDVPTSQVYYNAQEDTYSFVAYSAGDEHRLATVTSNGVVRGQLHLPPKTLARATELYQPSATFELLRTWPVDGETLESPNLAELVLIFSQPANAATLGGVSLAGPGITGIAHARTVDGLIEVFDVQGVMEAGAMYILSVPGSVASLAGPTLPQSYVSAFTVQAEAPTVAALVAHYRLDETVGTEARDESEAGLDGAYAAAPLLGQPGAQPSTGTSVAFNGTTQQVELGEPSELNTLINDFTVSLWVRPDSFGGSKILFGTSWHDYNGWSLRLVGSQIVLERLGPTQAYESSASLVAGEWAHVTAVYDADNDVTFFIDGVSAGTVAGGSPASVATEPWFIGNNGTGEGVVGRLDDVQIYRRALSGAEVVFLFDNPGRTIASMAADINGDGSVNLEDYTALAACLSGPAVAAQPACAAADMNGDGKVDLVDFMALQRAFR